MTSAASGPPAPTRRGARAVAAAAAVLAALGVAEVALRLTGAGAWALRKDAYHFVRDPAEPCWRMDPAHPPEHEWDRDPYGCLPPGARMTYEIGPSGLRGPDPEPGRPCVVMLGDSFTFGEGVPLADTFAARVARAASSWPDAPAVVNAGVPGYGTTEQAARLPSLLDRFAPRAVVLVAVPNDPIPLEQSLDVAAFINAKRAPEPPPVRLFALVRGAAERAESDRTVENWYLSYYSGERAFRWTAARRRLDEMRGRCRQRGVAFGIAYFPLIYRLDERPLQPIADAWRDAARELDVPFADLTDTLAGEPDVRLWVHPTDHHPNARAHELAAAALEPFVRRLAP